MRRFLSKSASRSGESESEENVGTASTAYEKRRAQVRKAQRRHRDRKANYIKALEHEVVNLRAENQDRVSEVLFLRGLLKDHGISAPVWQSTVNRASPGLEDLGDISGVLNPQSPPVASDINAVTLTVSRDGPGATPLHVALQPIPSRMALTGGSGSIDALTAEIGGLQSSSAFDPGSIAATAPDPMFDFQPDLYTSQPEHTTQFGNREQQYSQDIVDSLIGVEWVLSLEHPCMQHPEMTSEQYGTHSHMTSHQLLHSAPAKILQGRSSSPATWQVSGANIKQLLALSRTFDLPGELTPVQAWYKLRSDARFGNMRHAQLDRLKSLLYHDVKCYGFGAVIDEELWTLAVEETLSSTALQNAQLSLPQ